MISTLAVAALATPALSAADSVPALVVGAVLAALASALVLVSFRRRDAE